MTGKRISALVSILFMAIVWQHGLTLQSLAWCGFAAMLVVLSSVDLRTMLLPDALTQPLLWCGLITAALGWMPISVHTSLWGAVAGYSVLWLIAAAFELLTQQDGMGQGDFKLLAAIGSWLGWQALLPVLLLASTCGVVAGMWWRIRRQNGDESNLYIPFGPFLAGAAMVLVLWPSLSTAFWGDFNFSVIWF